MPTRVKPRHGSLQFWPRKRVRKALPSVNWRPVDSEKEGFLGFVAYKVGMTTAIVKDNTNNSMTKGKRIALPVTILEVPNMKIYSIRFYKNGKVLKEIVVSNDKEIKRKLKVSKNKKELKEIEGWDDFRVIAYSLAKQTNVKKTPDFFELGVKSENKFEFVKNFVNKEIPLNDVLSWKLVDVRGLTKGKGFSGPVKRFGITLLNHKSEKGVRKPGSLGPWHPARITFRVPLAGQLGMFSRIHYNLNVIDSGNIEEKDINRKEGFKNYGKIKTNYIILSGSVQGTPKRQIIITPAIRANKKQSKKNYELLELK